MIRFLRKLWKLNQPYKGRFVLGAVFGMVNGFAQPMVYGTAIFVFSVLFADNSQQELANMSGRIPSWLPGWVQAAGEYFKDWVTAQAAGSSTWKIAVVSLIPLVVALRGVVDYLSAYLMAWVSIRACSDLRRQLFEHLLDLPLSFFTRTSTGELMSRNVDVSILQNMLGNSLTTLVQAPVTILTSLVIMLTVDWKLTLVAAFVLSLCAIPISVYTGKGRRSSAAIQTEQAALLKVMHESFTGNRIIKAYNLEEVVIRQFKENLRRFISHFMRVVRATESPGPLMEFLGALGIACIFLHLARGNSTTPQRFSWFLLGLLSIYSPLKNLIRLHSQLTQAEAATQRVFDLLATPNHLTDPAQPKPVRAAGAEIHFDNVSFDYGEKQVLHHIELTVKPGQMVALVGQSGSGKTTLTNLLLRFYDPTEGALRIGGVDLREASIRDLRGQIAIVTQEIILFNDTIRNNIRYGRPGASAAEIETAARHAHAHEFIMEKPGGYEAIIGEKGVALSGGQRQRIAIARAILKDAPILVLDEATSALDNESERAVQAALDDLMQGRTTICIAHRLSTVQHADLIIVLDQGRIVETGHHEELLARGGIYQNLHKLQFKPTIEAQGTPQRLDPADADITRKISAEIQGAEGLSSMARAVIVTTIEGRVTLRGGVTSRVEKIRMGEIAARTVAEARVDNQLVIKETQ
jgi:ATP-binding cassette, subfamily B, bacterial MsbA